MPIRVSSARSMIWPHRPGLAVVLRPSASSTEIRGRVLVPLEIPIQIGRFLWTGLGLHGASRMVKCFPANDGSVSVHISLRIFSVSLSCSSLSGTEGNLYPYDLYSSSYHPVPIPITKRPLEIESMV